MLPSKRGHCVTTPSRTRWYTRQMALWRVVVLLTLAWVAVVSAGGQSGPGGAMPRDSSGGGPRATLIRAVPLSLTGEVDSNSPAVWELIDGQPTLVVMTSMAGRPSRSSGRSVRELSPAAPVDIVPWPGEGVWMEAVVRADDGTWYGFYHNERVAAPCGSTTKAAPRIGAARSTDFGQTWIDLGILIQAPPSTFDCATRNTYFVGGVGDLSAVLDREHQFLYVYFSQYGAAIGSQGIAAARFAWADRDAPVGKTDVWSGGQWVPAGRPRRGTVAQLLSGIDASRMWWVLPDATPLFATGNPWHDGDAAVDVFWGPSIHWNTHLERYVMLLNKAKDESFGQAGIYVAFNPTLEHAAGWSTPVRILEGGRWYPQVIGSEPGGGDSQAGHTALFFLQGRADHVIQFDR